MKKKCTVRQYGDQENGILEIEVGSVWAMRRKLVLKWLIDNIVAILALIVAVVALVKNILT